MSHIHGFIGRRTLLGLGMAGGISAMLGWNVKFAQATEVNRESMTPDTALKRLLDGNQRFVEHKLQNPDRSLKRQLEIAKAQHPFAAILSCADSRVPAEIIFDEGLGDLFDVRIAGNIATPEAVGSLEYATALLNTPLLMVVGHERCGAVTAAVENKPLPGKIGTFAKAIAPAVTRVKDESGDPVENAVVANVLYQIEQLKQASTLLTDLVETGKLAIVGGRYDLDTGKVTIVT
ncbi:MAG: carbonic anhydrase [Hydrococcus sp. Prado102]|jgi:carbonic anhydrase|nr:carbonic anhydrase [Hydrococcus sp. Prado102]